MLFFHLFDDQLSLDAHIQWIAFFRTKPWKHRGSVDPAEGSFNNTTGINYRILNCNRWYLLGNSKIQEWSLVFKHEGKWEKTKTTDFPCTGSVSNLTRSQQDRRWEQMGKMFLKSDLLLMKMLPNEAVWSNQPAFFPSNKYWVPNQQKGMWQEDEWPAYLLCFEVLTSWIKISKPPLNITEDWAL